MDLGLTGKTALITGGSAGLGLACAQALAAEGASVLLSSRSEEKLAAAAESIDGALTIAADVGDPGSRAALMDQAESMLGHVDIVIANAGGPPGGNFESTEVDAYRDAVELNMMSTIDLCKRFIPGMQSRRWGRVVAVTSLSVRQPMANIILSNTARAGLTAFLKTTAREVAKDGVTINSMQPGLHKTGRLTEIYDDLDALAETVPAKMIGDPADFGRVCAFLCSDTAKFITGAAIPLDGGAHAGLM